jgi:CheY-like chemotaxis protein
MGALAGGVAHDFNNILSVILMTCESVLRETQLPNEVRSELREVVSSGERAAALTRQLLAFSRKQVLQPRPLNLNAVVDGIYEMLKRLLKENIDFTVSPGQDLKNIKVDQGQIEQVILNLIVNSRDAMPKGGKIVLETQNVVLDKAMAAGNMRVEPGPYVMLAIRDTGIGMDANTQARIFEPFFTTKGQGSGTGLGLATVYGIVQQNKGSIWVYSEPGKGTVFKIYFPQIDAEVEKTSAPQQASKLSPASGTLVLVEDQEPLRRIMSSILTKEGYTVHEASNGLEALKVLQNIGFKADLILSDVIMPEMGGQQLAARVHSLGHKIKFLFLSGFTGDVVLDVDSSGGPPAFLEKPFNHRSLIDKVQSILAR